MAPLPACDSFDEYLLRVLAQNLRQTPPPFQELVGDQAGAYSRRINVQHRLVY